jgi:hypothetical protein
MVKSKNTLRSTDTPRIIRHIELCFFLIYYRVIENTLIHITTTNLEFQVAALLRLKKSIKKLSYD